MRTDIARLPECIIAVMGQYLVPNDSFVIVISRAIGIFQWTHPEKELVSVVEFYLEHIFIFCTICIALAIKILIEVEIVEQEKGPVMIAIIPNKFIGYRCLW